MAEPHRQRTTLRYAQVAIVPCALATLGWFAVDRAGSLGRQTGQTYEGLRDFVFARDKAAQDAKGAAANSK
jgi:hypothetical protein